MMLRGAAHLVCYYGPAGCSCVCCNHHAAIEERAHNGCSGACGLGQWHTLGVEGGIAVVVGEVEAGHGGGVDDVSVCGCCGRLRVSVCSSGETHGVVQGKAATV